MRRFRLLAWLVAAICSAATVSAQVTTGSIVGTVSDTQGQVVPGATVVIKEVGKQTSTTVVTDANGAYTAPFLNPGHLRGRGRAHRLQEVRPPGHHGPGQRPRPRRRQPRGRPADRSDHGHRGGAAGQDRIVRGRHGHRGEGHPRAAAERPQLRLAGLPRARRDAGPAGREPLRRQHVQPARRVQLQRPRPAGQHQRLARRRHRQQRVHVQHRHRRRRRSNRCASSRC